jgi:hypothetical protein
MTNNMKNISRKFGIMVLFLVSACQVPDDTINPSTLTPEAADANLLLNSIQLNFASFFNSATGNTD